MAKHPNVILLTLDCLRPDHLGCYGYKAVETPNIDWLAENGVRCENAYCHGTNTWVSHASIMTGLLPPNHGCRTLYSRIGQSAHTLAELLSANGYRTLGIPGTALVDRERGFDRGFDIYRIEEVREAGVQLPRHVLDPLGQWFKTGREPFAAWIHYFGLHNRKDPSVVRYSPGFSPFAQWYDGKISHADEHLIGPLIQMLKAFGVLEDTLLVITSDHGEDLNAVHTGGSGHNNEPKKEIVRIPLIFHFPERFTGGRVWGQCVRQVDLVPTICDICGIEYPEELDGVSHAAALEKGQDSADSSCDVYIENLWRAYASVKCGRHWLHADWGRRGLTDSVQDGSNGLRRRLALTADYIMDMLPALAKEAVTTLDAKISGGRGRRSKLPPHT